MMLVPTTINTMMAFATPSPSPIGIATAIAILPCGTVKQHLNPVLLYVAGLPRSPSIVYGASKRTLPVPTSSSFDGPYRRSDVATSSAPPWHCSGRRTQTRVNSSYRGLVLVGGCSRQGVGKALQPAAARRHTRFPNRGRGLSRRRRRRRRRHTCCNFLPEAA